MIQIFLGGTVAFALQQKDPSSSTNCMIFLWCSTEESHTALERTLV